MKRYFPQKFSAGTTFDCLVTASAYNAPEWSLVAFLRGPSNITLKADHETTGQRFSATAGETSAWLPGFYKYSVRAQRGAEVHEIEAGTVRVTPDIANLPDGYDGRSHAEKALEAIEAVLERRATMDQERYRINNRELYRTPIGDLLKLRDFYRAEVQRERAAENGKSLFGALVRVRLK